MSNIEIKTWYAVGFFIGTVVLFSGWFIEEKLDNRRKKEKKKSPFR